MKINKKYIVIVVISISIPLILFIGKTGKNVYDDVQGSVNEGAANIIAYDLAGASFVIPYVSSLSSGTELKSEDIATQAKLMEKDAGGYSGVTMTYHSDGNVEARMKTGEIGYACVKLEGFGRGKCNVAKLFKTKQ